MTRPFTYRNIAFVPSTDAPIVLTSGATQNVALPAQPQLRITNDGTATSYIAYGTDNTVTASAASIPLLGGSCEVMTPPDWAKYIAVYGTGSIVTIVGGEGL